MKALLKSLLALVLVLGTMNFAHAQQSVTATADVLADIAFIATQGTVDFSNVPQGLDANNAVLAPNAAGTDQNINGTPTVGLFRITGSASTSFDISWNTTASLTDGTGANPIDYAADIYGEGGDGTASARAPVSAAQLSNGSNAISFDATTSDFTIWIGGTLSTAASVPAGAYSTANTNGVPLTVTATYF